MRNTENNYFGLLVNDRNGNAYLFSNAELIPIEILNKDKESLNEPLIYKREIRRERETETLYGVINQNGIAVTSSIYTYIKILSNGNIRVSIYKDYKDRSGIVLYDKCCEINQDGFPLINGIPVKSCSFVIQYLKEDFWLCWSEGKFGLCNAFGYLVIPCEYDNIFYRSDWNVCQLKKNGKFYTAIMGVNGSIYNIINGKPLLESFYSKYLVACWTNKDEVSERYYKLLNVGGIEILHENFSEIKVFSADYVAAKRNNKWSLYFIGFIPGHKPNVQVLLSDLDDISYGTGNDDTKKIEYVSVNNSDGASLYYLKGIRIKNGLTIQNGKINFSTEIYDPESMDYKATENNYFVVEQNDEKSIYSIRGEKLEVLDTSEDYKSILTHTYGDGLIGFESNGKYGYMDLSGKVYIKPIFDYIEPFNDGKAKVKHSFDMCIDEYNGHYERNVETLIINKQRKVISRKLQWYYGREMDNYDIDGFDSWASYRDAFEDDSTAEWGRE